jgi:hypothetical protein
MEMLYFFELQLPVSGGQVQSYYFPLVINPQSISLSEPFSMEPTFTANAGLFTEENGIIVRNLRIRGVTGFMPRPLKGDISQLGVAKSGTKSYSRGLRTLVAAPISGQRHMQYLQDAVFRTYGDFKRDPSTSKDTVMIFHNPKESEDWVVRPRSFNMEQSVQDRTLYHYDIDLLVTGPATAVTKNFSEDKALLDQLRDKIALIQSTIAIGQAAIQDLTKLTEQLKGLVTDIAVVIDNVTSVVSAAGDFISGVTSLIESPYAILNSTSELLDAGLNDYYKAVGSGRQDDVIPPAIIQSMRQLGDTCDMFGTHPECFQTPAQAQVQALKQSQQLSQANTQDALTMASQVQLTSFQQVNNLGTGLMPGDLLRAQGQSSVGSTATNYTGSQVYTVSQGDTLTSLAAQFLGDARNWQYIAILNGLKPPFIDPSTRATAPSTAEMPLSGAVGLGKQILIPNFSTPPESQPVLPVLGAQVTDSAAAQFLGRDMLMAPVGQTTPTAQGSSRQLLDFVIDTEQGGTDTKKVEGIDNLIQGINFRTITEKGTDIMYQAVGVQSAVALNITEVDLQTTIYRYQAAWLADGRIASINRISVNTVAGSTAVFIDADLVPRGFASSTNVQIQT